MWPSGQWSGLDLLNCSIFDSEQRNDKIEVCANLGDQSSNPIIDKNTVWFIHLCLTLVGMNTTIIGKMKIELYSSNVHCQFKIVKVTEDDHPLLTLYLHYIKCSHNWTKRDRERCNPWIKLVFIDHLVRCRYYFQILGSKGKKASYVCSSRKSSKSFIGSAFFDTIITQKFFLVIN